jgi:glycerate-2-kinase
VPSATTKVRLIEGGVNNLPDENSHRAAKEIFNFLDSMTEDDLVLALISGSETNS